MKKVVMFFLIMLFFSCDKHEEHVAAAYYIKNTSNQIISFEVSIIKDVPMSIFGNVAMHEKEGVTERVFTCTLNTNDSIVFGIYNTWGDLKNHLNWFTKFEINPVDDIQMNDPYLPENWIKYSKEDTPVSPFYEDYKYSISHTDPLPSYLFILNKE